MIRIRYSKGPNNSLVSKPMVGGHHLVTITLWPEGLSFDATSEEHSFSSGSFSSMSVLKIEAKKYAKQLGVVFEDEIRVKDNSVGLSDE